MDKVKSRPSQKKEPESKNKKTARLLFEALLLKRILRTGWQYAGAPHESIGEHSFGAAVCSIALSRMEGLSQAEEHSLLLQVLLHDLHEVRCGDLNAVTKKYCKADIKQAEKDLFFGTHLWPKPLPPLPKKVAVLANDADKLDLLLTSLMNLKSGNENMRAFIKSALNEIKSKSAKKLAKELLLQQKAKVK